MKKLLLMMHLPQMNLPLMKAVTSPLEMMKVKEKVKMMVLTLMSIHLKMIMKDYWKLVMISDAKKIVIHGMPQLKMSVSENCSTEKGAVVMMVEMKKVMLPLLKKED